MGHARVWQDSTLTGLPTHSQETESRPNTRTELETETPELSINQNTFHLASSQPPPKMKTTGVGDVAMEIQLLPLQAGLSPWVRPQSPCKPCNILHLNSFSSDQYNSISDLLLTKASRTHEINQQPNPLSTARPQSRQVQPVAQEALNVAQRTFLKH